MPAAEAQSSKGNRFFMFNRGELQMLSRTGRAERRSLVSVPVHIRSLEHPEYFEIGVTQNVSPFGLRAIVKRPLIPTEPIQVESAPDLFRSRGWVVYCISVPGGNYAIGLRLLARHLHWSLEFGNGD